MAGVNIAKVQEAVIAAVTSKLGDSTDAESQFFSTAQKFKKSKISGEQFVSYSVETLGADTSGVVLPQMILLLAKYPERQESLRDAIADASLGEKSAEQAAHEAAQQEAQKRQAAAKQQAAEAAAVTAIHTAVADQQRQNAIAARPRPRRTSAEGMFICECKQRPLSNWEQEKLTSPLDRDCSSPNIHYWWSPEQQTIPRPHHFTPLRVEYSEGDWLCLVEGTIVLQSVLRIDYKASRQTKPVIGIRVEPEHPQILIFHPGHPQITRIKLNSKERLSPIIEGVKRLHAAHVEQLLPGATPVDLRVPVELCEGRVFDSSAFWRIWTESTASGLVLGAAGNGFSQSGYEYEHSQYRQGRVDSLLPATAIDFDASCLCLWVEGQKLNRSVDDQNCSDSSMGRVRLGLPRESAALQQLLTAAQSLAMTANVLTTSFPADLDASSLMRLPAVSLAAVRSADTSAVAILSDGLNRRGFCFVDVDDCLATLGDAAMSEAEAFLSTKSQQESHPSGLLVLFHLVLRSALSRTLSGQFGLPCSSIWSWCRL